jgi:diguanylate cyclase (GGDEF)-like protein
MLGRAFDNDGPVLETNGSGDARPVSAAAPVTFSGQVIGAIYVGFEPASQATPAQLLWMTDCYARLAGLCMSRDDLTLAAALGSASFDPLTGCLTYGAIVEVLKAEMQRTDRRGHRLSACMIDLDGFKRVNDEQGHLEGNRVLSAVGAALRGAARRYDAVGRFGGDEFTVVLPETGNGDGEQIAERFLANLRPAVRATTSVPVDASAGIMEWDGESSPVKLLDQADEMMRDAKRAGGGRVQSPDGRPKLDGLTELSRYMFGSFRAGRSNRNGDPG